MACICMHARVCMHVMIVGGCMRACVHLREDMHTCTYACRASTTFCVDMHVHACTHAYACTCVCTCVCAPTHAMDTHVHVCIYTRRWVTFCVVSSLVSALPFHRGNMSGLEYFEGRGSPVHVYRCICICMSGLEYFEGRGSPVHVYRCICICMSGLEYFEG